MAFAVFNLPLLWKKKRIMYLRLYSHKVTFLVTHAIAAWSIILPSQKVTGHESMVTSKVKTLRCKVCPLFSSAVRKQTQQCLQYFLKKYMTWLYIAVPHTECILYIHSV